MDLLIKSAKIINQNSEYTGKTLDILIQNGLISQIGKNITLPRGCKELIFNNLHVSEGWFDLRSNFCDPGFEHKEDLTTGLKAAAKGGFSAVGVIPNGLPMVDSKAGIEYIFNKTKGNIVDVFPIGSVSRKGEGIELAELYDMHLAGAKAFSDNKNSIDSSSLLNKALLYSQSFNGLIMSFPNDRDLSVNSQINEGVVSTQLGLKGSPSLAEELMVNRDIEIAEYCDSKLHITNISSKRSVEVVRAAKTRGIKVTADVNSYHLLLNEEELLNFNTNCKVLPPLRRKEDIDALIEGLKDNTIDVICSDHTPEDIENKLCEFDMAAPGMINLQTSFGVANSALSSKLKVEEIVEKMTTAPRKLLGIDNPGMEIGKPANLTLFNPDQKWTPKEEEIVSKSKNSPFVDRDLIGKVYGLINNHQVIIN